MKVRDIKRRRFRIAQNKAKAYYGNRCPEYDEYCYVCRVYKFISVHRRMPFIEELLNKN